MNSSLVTRRVVAGACALSILTTTACAGDDQPAQAEPPSTVRGSLLSVTPIGELDSDEVTAYLTDYGLDASGVENGVDAYRIVYNTIDVAGEPTTASGLVTIPDSLPDGAVRLVSWQHGTIGYRGEAGSVSGDSGDRAAAFTFASAGYVVSAPDYLGLGEGPGFHPYDHAASSVTASIDALLAIREMTELENSEVDSRLLISGFSQGGPVTMALGKAIQDGAEPSFSVAALAPIGGPYDMSGSLETAAAGGIAHVTAYLGYLTVAWNRLHHLYDSPSDAFLPPYDDSVEALFDGEHTTQEVVEGLPEQLSELFTPGFLAELRNPTGALRDALDEADRACDWKPEAPVVIYHATGDLDVPVANAEFCRTSLEGNGVEAAVIDLGDVDHGTSVGLALPLVLEQFRQS